LRPPPWISVVLPLGGLVRLAPRYIYLDDPFAGAVKMSLIRTAIRSFRVALEAGHCISRVHREQVAGCLNRTGARSKQRLLRNHSAFKHLVGDRSGYFVDEQSAHGRIGFQKRNYLLLL